MLKRMMSTLAALVVAGLLIIGVVMILTQQSWNANPLRDQMAAAAEPTSQDPWVLSEGERDAIVGQLEAVTYTDEETGELRRIDTTSLEGWTVREPMRFYNYTGSKFVQLPRWYYAVCHNDVAYVVVKAEAAALPTGTSPVPPAEECTWSWELVKESADQGLPGWNVLNDAYTMLDNDVVVLNSANYGMLYCNSGCLAMWANTFAGDNRGEFNLTTNPSLLDNVVTSDATKSYPLA